MPSYASVLINALFFLFSLSYLLYIVLVLQKNNRKMYKNMEKDVHFYVPNWVIFVDFKLQMSLVES